MRSKLAARIFAPLVVAAALPAFAASEDSFRCEGGLVSVGDLKVDLIGKCGEPALREAIRTEEVAVLDDVPGAGSASLRETAPIERWTYDLGRGRFLELVTLEAGRIRSIERGGRGHADPAATVRGATIPVARCDQRSIHVGDDSYDLLARCGPPATRDVKLLERAIEQKEGDRVVRRSFTVALEVWTFHFGPQTLTRVAELEDGKVVKVETGSRGYAP